MFSLLLRVLGYLRAYKRETLIAYSTLVGTLTLNAVIPQLIRWTIDNGISQGDKRILMWSAIALMVLTILKGVLNYWQGIMSEQASQNVAYDLRNQIQRKLTQLSFSFHDQSETGELLSRAIQDVERIRFVTGRAFLRIAEAVVMLTITVAIMFTMNFRLAGMILVLIPLLMFQAIRYGMRYRPLSLKVQKQLATLTTTVEQNLRGARVVKAFAQEEAEIGRFNVENNRWFDMSIAAARMQAINQPLLFLIANVGTILIIYFGGLQVTTGQVTMGEVIAFITYLGQLIDPVRRLGMIIPAISIASSSAERIFDILDTISEVEDSPNARVISDTAGHIEFENVSFSFGRKKILQNINLIALPGETIALLGSTGSGKSSLINLIPRFYDPTSGIIKLDGLDIRKISLHSLRQQIGIVLQETILFSDTIRENIAFGVDNPKEEDIIGAAQAAQAHEFILQTAHGYDTRVGERGATLSGGQKQRLAIARAILLNPRILILDDATSSVDTETEHLIQQAFATLMRGRTSFVIAHRLSTVRSADKIIVMDQGKIAASGRHEELIKTSSHYRAIYEQQLKKQEPGL